MPYNKYQFAGILVLVFIGIYVTLNLFNISGEHTQVRLKATVQVNTDDEFKLYYTQEGQEGFNEANVFTRSVQGKSTEQEISFLIPPQIKPTQLRLELGQNPEQGKVKLKDLRFVTNNGNSQKISLSSLVSNEFIKRDGDEFTLSAFENRYNPYVTFDPYTVQSLSKIGESPTRYLLLTLLFFAVPLVSSLWSKNRNIAALCGFISILFFLIAFTCTQYIPMRNDQRVSIEAVVELDDLFKIYLLPEDGTQYSEQFSVSQAVTGSTKPQTIVFTFPDTLSIKGIRLDIGNNSQQKPIRLMSIKSTGSISLSLEGEEIYDVFALNDFVGYDKKSKKLVTQILQNNYSPYDPFLNLPDCTVYAFNSALGHQVVPRIIFSLLASICLYLTLIRLFPQSWAQVRDFAFIAAFVFVLIAPLIDNVVGFKFNKNNTENRTPIPRPKISRQNIASYPRKFEEYYNDHVGFRNILVQIGARLKTNLFHASVFSDRVLIGEKRWIFYVGEHQNIINDIKRVNLLPEDQLKNLVSAWEAKQKRLDSAHINYYFTAWPDKHTIYPQYFPLAFKKQQVNSPSRYEQVVQYCKSIQSPLHLIDMRGPISAASKTTQLYLKNDTHWNDYGAFIGYQVLLNRIAEDRPEINPVRTISDYTIEWKEKDSGDLLNVMGMASNPAFTDLAPIFTPKKIDFNIINLSAEGYPSKTIHYANTLSKNKLKAIVFRDSYTISLVQFIAPHFSETLYIWAPYDQSIVDAYKPDVVIEGFVERFSFQQ